MDLVSKQWCLEVYEAFRIVLIFCINISLKNNVNRRNYQTTEPLASGDFTIHLLCYSQEFDLAIPKTLTSLR